MKRKFILFILITVLYCKYAGIAQEKDHQGLLLTNLSDSLALLQKTLPANDYSNLTYNIKDVNNKYVTTSFTQHGIHQERLVLSCLSLISLNYAIYQPFKDAWWEEDRSHFHFYRGWRRTKGYWDFGWHDTLYGHIDKLGHYYSARFLSEQICSISRWIGFSESSSKLIGPVLSSLLMLEIEIYDGFFKEWGFSLADFTANELGAFSPLMGEKIPFLNNFQLKFSYHSSNLPEQETTFIKDYAGMTFWLSYNIKSLLPPSFKKYYPPWLNLALGYSVSRPTRGKVELYLAPDINWMKVPIGNSEAITFIKKTLNYLHFPCFCLKLMPDKRFYPIYF
jgi:hypothetical protein